MTKPKKKREVKKRNWLVPHLMTRSGGGKHRNKKKDQGHFHPETK